MSVFVITKEGMQCMEKELHQLKAIDRPHIIKEIAKARSFGDLSENAEYHAAKDKQSFIEGKISDLESKTANAQVIDVTKLDGNKVKFGATVELLNLETEQKVVYQIVSSYETDIEKGKISVESPIAKAIMNKQVEDIVEVHTPRAIIEYEILSIEFK